MWSPLQVGDALEGPPHLDRRQRDAEPKSSVGGRAPRRSVANLRRLLLVSDLAGLTLSFVVVTLAIKDSGTADSIQFHGELAVFVCALPFWFIPALIVGLYDLDESRVGHNTVDELFGVVSVVTIGTWIVLVLSWTTGVANPQLSRLVAFWLLACIALVVGRAGCRHLVRSSSR